MINSILWIIISGVILLVSIVMGIKSYLKKDVSLLGGIFARVFFIVSVVLYALFEGSSVTLHFGVLIVAISDLTLNLLYIFSRKYFKEIEHNKLVKSFADLQNKYFTVVEHAPIGFFMIDDKFQFEFANGKTAEILECTRPTIYTKTPFDFVIPTQHERLQNNLNKLINCKDCEPLTTNSEYTIKTCSGKFKRIKVISDRTRNGHVTITGSISLIEG